MQTCSATPWEGAQETLRASFGMKQEEIDACGALSDEDLSQAYTTMQTCRDFENECNQVRGGEENDATRHNATRDNATQHDPFLERIKSQIINRLVIFLVLLAGAFAFMISLRAFIISLTRLHTPHPTHLQAYMAGNIRGFMHLDNGQESIPALLKDSIRKTDLKHSYYRDHCH